MSKLRDSNIHDSEGNALESQEGALNVNVKAIHTNMINSTFHFETANFSTFANPVTAGDRTFDVVDGTVFNVGDRVQIENGVVETNYPTIIDIATNTITINRPIDKDYTIADDIRAIEVNMAVDGSVTPVSFKIVAEASLSVAHITRLLFNMVHDSAGDMGKFGGIPELERGVLFRAWYKRTNEYKTISLWRSNADIAIDMFDVRFDTRSGGGGDYGTSGRWTFASAGIVAELFPDTPPDFLEILIQDDLTDLNVFSMNAQGYTDD